MSAPASWPSRCTYPASRRCPTATSWPWRSCATICASGWTTRFGIPRRYPDHRALLADPELEAVAISGAYAVQGEIARECLAAGKHVFVEKPLAVSVAQAERILEAGRATGARLMVAMMKRYDAGNELARRIIGDWRRTGEAGPITLVRAHNFAGDWIAGLGAPLENSDEPMPAAPLKEHLSP